MTNLTILTAKRKFLRTSVTTEFNKYQNNIPTSQAEIQRLRAKFEKLGKDLDLLDTEILDQKFAEESEYSVLEKEFIECEDYINKCQDMIATLDTIEIDSPSISAPHLYTNVYNMTTLTETNNHIDVVNEFKEEIVCNLSSEILNKFLMDDDECNESEFDNTVTHLETNSHVQLANEDFVCNLSYEILDETSVNIEEINEGDSSNMITHTEETHNDEVVNEFGKVVLYSSSHIIFDDLVHDKKVHEKGLNVVTQEALENQYCRNTSLYVNTTRNDTIEKNEHLIHFAFQNGEKVNIGEPNMPLFWGGQAYYLSSEIKNLDLMKRIIRSQENEGVLKRMKILSTYVRSV